MYRFSFLSLIAAVFMVGCEQSPPPPASSSDAPPPPRRTTSAPAAPDTSSTLFDAVAETEAELEAEKQPKPEPEMISEVATVGSGKKGHGYGGGMITEPVRAYFRTRERVVFEITIPNAMKTFKAIDPKGKGPASHEEFMEKIIRENAIELPALPDGWRYRYDPETEDLMVERPKTR